MCVGRALLDPAEGVQIPSDLFSHWEKHPIKASVAKVRCYFAPLFIALRGRFRASGAYCADAASNSKGMVPFATAKPIGPDMIFAKGRRH